MAMIKQAILIRTDLQFPIGLLAAQVAHIHALPLVEAIHGENNLSDWIANPYIYVYEVQSLDVLNYFTEKAKQKNLTVIPWFDTVNIKIGEETVPFENVLVGVSIGPCDSDKIKTVIGALKLLGQ